MRARFAIVIPVYNHATTAASVAERAVALGAPVIVVDDGSTDDLQARMRDVSGVRVLMHSRNLGKGAAILTGLEAASTVADWAITIDADGQHDPADAARLLAAVAPHTRPLVVGRREGMLENATVPWTSRFGRGFSNFWVRSSGGPRVTDSQSGFRAYPVPEALRWNTRSRRFQFEVEVLVRAHWRRVPILEVPISVTYAPPGGRISHFRPFVDFCRNSATFLRLIVTNLFIRPFRPALPPK